MSYPIPLSVDSITETDDLLLMIWALAAATILFAVAAEILSRLPHLFRRLFCWIVFRIIRKLPTRAEHIGSSADWRFRPIEPGILPLVNALNGSGVARTIASCEGHHDGDSPYVAFISHPDFAAAIAREIWEEVYEGEGLLNGWAVEGGFDPDFRLTFSLRSSRLTLLQYSGGWSYARLYLQRQRLDREIACLSALIDKAAQRVPHPRSIEEAACSA